MKIMIKNLCSFFIGLTLSAFCISCGNQGSKNERVAEPLFSMVSQDSSGIDFENRLSYDTDFNIYTYRNFYNGGGVAIGDINNDNLPDIFFTANLLPNRLYLNKGNFHFEDITASSGIGKKGKWSTGVSMADVNDDGLLDIYVCNSGGIKGDSKENELYINQGEGKFLEEAAKYGLADRGYSTQAVFFDYDRDNDLDAYLLNNSFRAIGSFDLRKNQRNVRDSLGGHKLFRNDNGHFVDVSEQAGIYGSIIGFGLGVSVSDIDRDGWPDLYVSNDFFEKDYLYINKHDGTFTEELEKQMMSISSASMGSDVADINNDGFTDIFTTEMLPRNEARLKNNTSFESWDKYRYALNNGYYHQFTRNALQLNTGNNSFSEIGRFSELEATDWSWGALLTDFDNDGNKDIFVANGIFQDLTNQDYIQYISNDEFSKSMVRRGKVDYKKLIDLIPSIPVPNYAFLNMGNLHFTESGHELGLDQPSFSNGSAYGDLDNDGAMDLVVNNVNMPPFVYRNRGRGLFPGNHFLRIRLNGSKGNSLGVGAKVTLRCGKDIYYQEQFPTRGFESTVDNRLLFGVGGHQMIDSIVVEWPDGAVSILTGQEADRETIIGHAGASILPSKKLIPEHTFFAEGIQTSGLNNRPHGNEVPDFDYDRLCFQNHSGEGPRIAKADVNRDGRTDLYVCGGSNRTGILYIQQPNQRFVIAGGDRWNAAANGEETDAIFFDADNDGDSDLFVCRGGNGLLPNSPDLVNYLLLNDGKGDFRLSSTGLPAGILENSSAVSAADYDRDGDQDLFVGVRYKALKYGYPAKGYILQNDGLGRFTDATNTVAPGLASVGMIADAEWFDANHDGYQDLVICGEYMPVRVFFNQKGHLIERQSTAGLSGSEGWWTRLAVYDINKDGYDDIIAGNHGMNSRFRASEKKPVTMYVNDFDENGTVEQVVCCYNGDKQYPVALRHDLLAVIPSLKKKFLKYSDYGEKTMEDIFSPDVLSNTLKLNAVDLRSAVFINDRKEGFSKQPLPQEAQLFPVYAICVNDYNFDGHPDLLMGGNLFTSRPEAGIYDAGHGLLLCGDGKGQFTAVKEKQSGLYIRGEVRDIVSVRMGNQEMILWALKNEKIKVMEAVAPVPARDQITKK